MQRHGGELRHHGGRRPDDFRLYDDLRQLGFHFFCGRAVLLRVLDHHRLGTLRLLFRTSKAVRPFLVIYSFVAILGATVNLDLLWNIADTFNGLMSIPNLIALLLLSGTVVKLTKEFFAKEDGRKLKK